MSGSSFYRTTGKHIFDVMATLLCGIIALPLGLLVALIVRMRLGSPVLYRQRRPGINGVPFTILKFRTMTNEADGSGTLLPDAQRLIPFGSFLRATSLDELPELWNVLRGEMSLVGPRPLLLQYLDRYTAEQARRHEVLPGITGWAQVNGRNALSWSEKFAYDVWYVDNMSFILDIKILLRTVQQVLSRAEINQPGAATAEEYTGGKDE